jgi:two-component system response regulator PilR (NtrC family)
LAEQLCAKLTGNLSDKSPRLSAEAITALGTYDFPGNVRELENILERALTLCDGSEISEQDLRLPETEHELSHETNYSGSQSLEGYLEQVEKEAIQNALVQTNQNKTAAAKLLGITFRALRYKLEKLGIE